MPAPPGRPRAPTSAIAPSHPLVAVSVREARDAGRIPTASVTKTTRTTVNATTPASNPTSLRRGSTVGVMSRSAGSPPATRAAPIAPPPSASSRLSASTTPGRISLEASTADRSPRTVRARISTATLTQTRSNITPTASCTIVNGWRIPPNRASRHGVSSTVQPLSRFGYFCAYSSSATFTAAWASAIETPGFKRPMARRLCCVSCPGAGSKPNVNQASEELSRSPKPSGMTPMIWVGCPSTCTVWPTTSGRPAKRRCHTG